MRHPRWSSRARPASARPACCPSWPREADRRGWTVLHGSASELERDLPFWVFVDALDAFVAGLNPRVLDGLSADMQAELAQVLPSLAERAAPAAPVLQDQRYRVHRATRALLERLAATQPLVLILDDVHWADPASVDLLAALLREPPAAAVLLVLAARPHQLADRLGGALDRADRAGGLVRIPLGGLPREATAELLGRSASTAAVDRLQAETGGNPFYLLQLSRVQAGGTGARGRHPARRPRLARGGGRGAAGGGAAAAARGRRGRRPVRPRPGRRGGGARRRRRGRRVRRAARRGARARHGDPAPLPLPPPRGAARRLRGGAGRLAPGCARSGRSAPGRARGDRHGARAPRGVRRAARRPGLARGAHRGGRGGAAARAGRPRCAGSVPRCACCRPTPSRSRACGSCSPGPARSPRRGSWPRATPTCSRASAWRRPTRLRCACSWPRRAPRSSGCWAATTTRARGCSPASRSSPSRTGRTPSR